MDSDRLTRHSLPGWAPPVLVALITAATFLPALQNGFVDYDDPENFLANPHYRGLGPAQLKWMFTTFHMGIYVPLAWVTLGLDYALWGMNPVGYHLTNLVFHVVNAVLVYFVALRLLRAAGTDGEPAELGLRLGAGFAASVFAIHPLRVESVAWVTERRDVVSGFFFLVAILAYLRFCRPGPGETGKRPGWYWASLGACFLALLSKPSTVGLPVVLVALDAYPLRRLGEGRRVWVEKIPFAVLAGGVALATLLGMSGIGMATPLSVLGIPERLASSSYSLVFYLRKTLVPQGLAPLYQLRLPVEPWSQKFLLSGALVAAITTAAAAWRRRWPALGVAWITYVAMLLPVVGLWQHGAHFAADRFSYLACLGWAVLAGGGLAWSLGRRRAAPVVALVASVVVVILAVLTSQQVRVWRDSVTLWTHAASVEPSSPIVANNLMVALLADGRIAEAHALFKRTIPDLRGRRRTRWFFTMAAALQANGDVDDAGRYYQEVIALDPNNEEVWNNLGAVYATRGETSRALEAFLRALEINPRYEAACENGRRAAQIVGVTPAVLEGCGAK
ncbi:MAG: tetratricopeptide repeat protein [Candidatus Rokubacteria bacterium]|nr:tetratricopeptide repeat protein [Candidatus Rokubacteria bacterium]